MRFSESAYLIDQTYKEDDIGQDTPVETERKVFVNPFSIGSEEYYGAAQAGLRPECELQMRTDEYNGEKYLRFRDKRLKVERTRDGGEYIRLVCGRVNADV